ncbi:MAG: hypothetical protein IJV25_02550 [Prevotella sp.]|nr:hypothetical protein [Prevotella sp.]
MEKDKDDLLLKDRSSRACISAGYRLYMSNFKRIFRASWLAALVFAALVSIGGTMMILRPQLALIALPLTIIIDALFTSYGFSVLKQHQESGTISWAAHWYSFDTHVFTRTLKAWLCMIAISLIISCLIAVVSVTLINYLSTYTALATIVVIALTVFVFILPLTYTNLRYILTDGTGYWSNLFGCYGKGMRRWGFIFLVVFMTTLIGWVFYVFTSLPAIILSMAGSEANKGFLYGDPYNLPSYIGWLSALVFLLIGFIQAYVMLSCLFPLYYMYGSIEAHEQEKNKFNNSAL